MAYKDLTPKEKAEVDAICKFMDDLLFTPPVGDFRAGDVVEHLATHRAAMVVDVDELRQTLDNLEPGEGLFFIPAPGYDGGFKVAPPTTTHFRLRPDATFDLNVAGTHMPAVDDIPSMERE